MCPEITCLLWHTTHPSAHNEEPSKLKLSIAHCMYLDFFCYSCWRPQDRRSMRSSTKPAAPPPTDPPATTPLATQPKPAAARPTAPTIPHVSHTDLLPKKTPPTNAALRHTELMPKNPSSIPARRPNCPGLPADLTPPTNAALRHTELMPKNPSSIPARRPNCPGLPADLEVQLQLLCLATKILTKACLVGTGPAWKW
jgi:hypothetical protein